MSISINYRVLKEKFRENKKIFFDEDKNSNKSYLESDIIISDWSGAEKMQESQKGRKLTIKIGES